MNKQEATELIMPHVYEEKGRKFIKIPNARLDFEQRYLFFGITESGNVILGEITGEGSDGIKHRRKIAKIRYSNNDPKRPYLSEGTGTGTNILALYERD